MLFDVPHILAKLFVFIFLHYFSLFKALCVFILWFCILEYIPGLLSSFLRYNTCYWNCSLEFWLPRYSYFILFIEIQEVEITFRYLSCILKYFPADIFRSLEEKLILQPFFGPSSTTTIVVTWKIISILCNQMFVII